MKHPRVFLKFFATVIFVLCFLLSSNAWSQTNVLANVRVDQKLNAQVPLQLSFRDETGKTVSLDQLFGKKPVILVLAYYECPNLCTLVLNAVLTSVQDIKLDAGKDFEIVVVSINPHDTTKLAAAKKQTYAQRYGRPNDAGGWHFLTGDEPAITSLAESMGFHYQFDPQSKQYAHPSAIMVLTPQGKVSRYFAGIEYPPKELRLALVEASNQHIGSLTDQLFLYCFHYNPLTGKYGVAITRILRTACCATVLGLGIFITTHLRNDKRALKT